MSNLIKDLLTPEQGRLLDNQLRQKQLNQGVTNYGSDAIGKLLTSVSGAQRASAGFGMAAERAIAGRQMGANEAGVVAAQQRKEAELKKRQAIQRALQGKNRTELSSIYKNNVAENPELASMAMSIMDSMDSDLELGVKAAQIAKDFTGKSAEQFFKTRDASVLVPKQEKENKYVLVNTVAGEDDNGQPIMKSVFVDRSQIGELTNNATVVDITDLTGKSVVDPSVPSTVDVEVPEEEKQAVTRLGGVSGMTLKDTLELREKTERDVQGLTTLLKRLKDPSASNVLGKAKIINRNVGQFLETEEGVLSRYFDMEALQGAISAAKLLGVNPTDKDFQKSLESRPNMNDGKAVWEDWTYTKFIPSIKNAITSQYDTDDKRAKQIISMLDTIVSDAKETKEVKKTTSSGTSYIIMD
jgi:hypothetical protein